VACFKILRYSAGAAEENNAQPQSGLLVLRPPDIRVPLVDGGLLGCDVV
jgi:hypothetical protein